MDSPDVRCEYLETKLIVPVSQGSCPQAAIDESSGPQKPLPEGSKPHSDRRRCVALYSGVWGNDSGYIEAMHLAELCANQEIMVPDEYPNSPLHLCDYPISRSIFHWSRSLWLTTEHLPGLGIIMSSDMPRYLPHKVLMAIGIVGRSYEPSTALRSTMATTS